MEAAFTLFRNLIVSAVIAWLGLEFTPDRTEPESPPPAEKPDAQD
jgi:hypothetical protein